MKINIKNKDLHHHRLLTDFLLKPSEFCKGHVEYEIDKKKHRNNS